MNWLRTLVAKGLSWVIAPPHEDITTGLPVDDALPLLPPEPQTVVRATLANGEVWEMPLTHEPGAA